MVPREKGRALDSCFGLISHHQQSIPHPYLQAPRVYKAEQWRCTCCYEMRFMPTRLCHCYALIHHPSIHGLEPRLRPTPIRTYMINNLCGAKRKRAELWTAVSGLLALIGRAYILHPYLQAPRGYKGQQWRCNCGYEMRLIHTRLCHCYALICHVYVY